MPEDNNDNNNMNGGRKSSVGTILMYLIIAVLLIAVLFMLFGGRNAKTKTYSEILQMFENDEIKSFTIKGSTLTVVDTKGNKYSQLVYDPELFLKQIGLDDKISNSKYTNLETWSFESDLSGLFISLLPIGILLIGTIILFVIMTKRTTGEANKINMFSRANINFGQGARKKVYFSDVAGIDEEKEELKEVVDYLKYPKKYRKLGAKIPRGVLLSGKPGTGKTLLAKACATEAGVPFLSISGSDFVEMFVGVGASRVRDLFNTAKKAHSAIIFIDEIDAVGRHRGTGIGGGNDEREQTLNQILVEMDGFNTNDNIIVIAATNRPDILDPALTRPGRFDRQITIPLPDLEGRKAILKVHAANRPFSNDIDFDYIAGETVGFTGADLANLLNEAALIAARKNKNVIDQDDISDAYTKVAVGTQRKKAKISEKEKKNTAYHECGHAITGFYLETQPPVKQISIIPSGPALGYTLSVPLEDKYNYYKKELQEELVQLLGGRAAEEIVFGDISAGAANDISRATSIAKSMVTKYGMSDLGTVMFGSPYGDDEMYYGRDYNTVKNYSDATAALIDKEIKKLIDEAYEKAKQILSEHRDQLDFLANYLVKHELITGEEFEAAMNGADEETLDQLTKERRDRIAKENEEQRKRDEEHRRREEERRRREEERRRKENDDDDDDPMNRFRRYR